MSENNKPRTSKNRYGGRSRGQATVLVLLFIVVLLIGVFVLYNVGQLTSTKMQLQNASDATAYSAAVMVARDYNFAAYLNRGMVANQVAIAQVVGLSSWSRYYCTIFNSKCGQFPDDQYCELILPSAPTSCGAYEPLQIDIDTLKGEFEGKNATNGFLLKIYAPVSKALYDGIKAAGPGLVDSMNIVVRVMSNAELLYNDVLEVNLAESLLNTGPLAGILHANDPNANIQSPLGIGELGLNLKDVRTFTERYTPLNQENDPQNRFHAVVMADRDEFSKHRSGATDYAEAPPFPLVWFGTCDGDGNGLAVLGVNYGIFDQNTYLYTTLSANNNNWTAGDAAIFAVSPVVGVCVIPADPIPIPVPIFVPLAPFYGSNYAYTGQGVSWPSKYKVGSYSGLQPYYDVKNLQGADPASPTLTFLVSQGGNTVDTTANSATLGSPIGAPAGTAQEGAIPVLRLNDHEANGAIEAVSASDAYFARPQSDWELGGSVVYGNLFNPYWEAHLVPVSSVFRIAAAAQQGG